MDIAKFKSFSVIVNNGSGILFQPLTDNFFYILTAKHNLQQKQGEVYVDLPEKTPVNIVQFAFDKGSWSSQMIPFQLEEGTSYFPHNDTKIDAAILKVRHNLDEKIEISGIHVSDCIEINGDAYLCGFPNDKRKVTQDLQLHYASYKLSHNSNETARLRSIKLSEIQRQDTVEGMSGGGVVRIQNNHFELLGIQSSMTRTLSDQNEIDVLPISLFEEIVENYPVALSYLLPAYMVNFDSAFKDALTLKDANYVNFIGVMRMALTKKLSQVNVKPIEIVKSEIAKLLLVSNENKSVSNSKEFWICCLEYILILSIILDKDINIEEFKNSLATKRFLYSSSDAPLNQLIPDILNSDFDGMEQNSSIIVSTKHLPPLPDRRKVSSGVLNNICYTNNFTAQFQITQAENLSRIKEIIHIKAFEMDCIIAHEETLSKYSMHQLTELIANLKNIIDEFLEN